VDSNRSKAFDFFYACLCVRRSLSLVILPCFCQGFDQLTNTCLFSEDLQDFFGRKSSKRRENVWSQAGTTTSLASLPTKCKSWSFTHFSTIIDQANLSAKHAIGFLAVLLSKKFPCKFASQMKRRKS
jgi:hypothetical protein